jgi:RNA polymerase sigma factor (sigma-70 family)
MIRLPVHVQTVIRNVHKRKKEMEATTGRRPSMPELAHEMGIPLDKLHLYQHFSKNVLSLELPVDGHSDAEDKRTLGDRVACTEMATPDEDFMSESLRGEVHAMLDGLGPDERLVLTHRFGLDDGRPKSLRETAEGMGVSSDIVRTVEAKALNKLRQPRMNYRLKGYVGGSEDHGGGEPDCAEPHYGWAHNTVTNYEDHQQQHNNHFTYHMNTPRLNGHDFARDDDHLEDHERPTPESIWSF